ncbi:DUF294 nucleotidyltransferase-like domain-containing protein [Pseudooceanicola sp. 502str34]
MPEDTQTFLAGIHPYDTLPAEERAQLCGMFRRLDVPAGQVIFRFGERLDGLYVVRAGHVRIEGEQGEVLSHLMARNSFGERGLMRDGFAASTAIAEEDCTLFLLPAGRFLALIEAHEAFRRFFSRGKGEAAAPRRPALTDMRVAELMAADPTTCEADTPIRDAAALMRERRISSLPVLEKGALAGIVTIRDMSNKVVAGGIDPTGPVAGIMTRNPLVLAPSAIGSDVLHAMMEHRIGHIPVVEAGRLVGIVTQTNLTRAQAESSAHLVRDLAQAQDVAGLAAVTAKIPALLRQLVGAGNRHDVVTRLITDIADTVTRRLLAMAEAELGPPPVPYLWAACGSQGRQEQTGVSDQDNCLILDDAASEADMAYFTRLARIVSDGLNACGYVYCPGDMMATNPRWCQPLAAWRRYFAGWIAKADPESQMLSSVMFDLRGIGGQGALLTRLQEETLGAAAQNTIFVAQMVANSLKHTPPLGLLRGFATFRSGEHKDTIDLKHNGVVPVTDLGRVYALQGRLPAVNTRARLQGAMAAGIVSPGGGQDLLDAYDLIAQTRLEHQARQVAAGEAVDNFMAPARVSDFERSHLRDAFVVVRRMQSAAGSGRGVPG